MSQGVSLAAVAARSKATMVSCLVPLARFYIRYSPIGLLKPFLWARTSWRPRQFRARTRFGVTMAGDSLDLVQGHVYYFGIWEPNLTAFVKRRLSGLTGRTFIDVGANVGYFSLLAAKQMPAGSVVSIEAFPSIYAKLKENIGLNGFSNVRTVPQAATQAACQIEMFHGGPANEGATTSVPGKFQTTSISVSGKPLSELLTDAEVRSARMIKIDVEGAEHSVIQGMRSILDKFQPDVELVVEITPAVLGREKTDEIFGMFEAAGYLPYALDNSYEDSGYLTPQATSSPKRLRSRPSVQTDVVFSRMDAQHL